jgi:hypothetical protein
LLLASLCFWLPFAFDYATQRQKASKGKRQAKAKGKQRQKAKAKDAKAKVEGDNKIISGGTKVKERVNWERENREGI